MVSPAGIFPSVLPQDLCTNRALCLEHSFSMAGVSSFSTSPWAAVLPSQRGYPAKVVFASVTPVLLFSLTSVIEINLFI